MLTAAGVPFEALSPNVDEEAFKEDFRARGLDARHIADALAEMKALRLSSRAPGALVLGCDQTLELEDGAMIDKAVDRADAAAILRRLSGKTHMLHSAAVICEQGRPVWRHIEKARMTVRPLSDAFIEAYLDREWDQVRWCVGCYRIEGP
ncbi:MAG: septum formation protein Maf, partial [Sphingobium sp. 32-64-5]